MPSPGRITRVEMPSGPGVRLDGGIYAGWNVPMHYDPLLAKLAVWAEDRPAAVRRLARALDECEIEGIKTTLPFFRALVRCDEFAGADYDTGFIERFVADRGSERETDPALRDIAAIASVLHATSNVSRNSAQSVSLTESKWKLDARVSGRR